MITVDNIHKSFPIGSFHNDLAKNSGGSLEVLKGIDFKVDKGEIVSIVGASGAGKTTLLQIMGTLDKPDKGNIFIDEMNLQSKSGRKLANYRNKHIGFIFQFHHLLPEFSALENVCIPAYIGKKSKKEAEEKARELLEFLNLSDRMEHKPRELSGGEQQRVSIARAFVNRPPLLLADEPTGNLDPATSLGVMTLFNRINRSGTTILIATHDREMVDSMRKRVIALENGNVVRDQLRGVYGYED